MVWERPVPLIGDVSAASQRAGDPAGWAFPEPARQAFYDVLGARRDVRRFRPDPVDGEILTRVLAAAHAAPSVGHSQPWRFVLVRDPATRERAALMADQQRLRQVEQMDPESGLRLLDLQLEGIREAPLGVVVCCDRRAPAAGVLGRATFVDTDLWSCACAIQNLWLAARAEGLGVGWVTLFDPDELATLLALPAGVVTLGWLCLGWPDERPPRPGLERVGWSRKLPLSQVVLDERWPADEVAPAPPPSRLRAPDQSAVVAAHDAADRLLSPPGSLGLLSQTTDRILALGHTELTGGVLVLAAADHPVARHRVSAYPTRVTREVLEAAVAGEAMGVTAARAAGLTVDLVDAGVTGPPVPGAREIRCRDPRGDLVGADAMSRDDTDRLVEAGRGLGATAATHGLVALGEVGVANTTVAAALTCALLDLTPAAVVGLGAGADSAMVDRKRAAVSAATARLHATYGGSARDPLTCLAALGGPEIAVLTGVVLGAAERGAVVVLDGLATSVAALIAVAVEPGVAAHLVAGQRSRELGHPRVLTQLGCEPLLSLRVRAGEGVGACLASAMIRHALTIRRHTARVTY
ncbi:5,6-dimethylbenzimidazole synthase [Micromonospora rosaria]|uniref:Nicotinate-nucleotide--dimethylbenzimidazole phosphoribosyltransferase n=1 Tax=Micromonospora rosaria TaxID=47874 RepID=A0A136PN09_9ACTN|nr:5,6-dimethylbenzimidazole synthase [Micromonospora rosaria]KXK59744.1 5,6-dimethylbenzimidazole synthase [Micromonospora rosaria]